MLLPLRNRKSTDSPIPVALQCKTQNRNSCNTIQHTKLKKDELNHIEGGSNVFMHVGCIPNYADDNLKTVSFFFFHWWGSWIQTLCTLFQWKDLYLVKGSINFPVNLSATVMKVFLLWNLIAALCLFSIHSMKWFVYYVSFWLFVWD